MIKKFIKTNDIDLIIKNYYYNEFNSVNLKEKKDIKKYIIVTLIWWFILWFIIYFWYNSVVYEEDKISLLYWLLYWYQISSIWFIYIIVLLISVVKNDRYSLIYKKVLFEYLYKKYSNNIEKWDSIFLDLFNVLHNNKLLNWGYNDIIYLNSLIYHNVNYDINALDFKLGYITMARYWSHITDNWIIFEIKISNLNLIKIKELLNKEQLNNWYLIKYNITFIWNSLFLKYNRGFFISFYNFFKWTKFSNIIFYNEFEKINYIIKNILD